VVEETEVKLYSKGLDFFNITPKAQVTIAKISQIG
jgi:hypothetical protein